MDKLHSLQYVDGYRTALMDVLETFKYIDIDLKSHKRKRTAKEYMKIIEAMLENRVCLRENPDTFIRCSTDGGYEVFNEKLQKVVSC